MTTEHLSLNHPFTMAYDAYAKKLLSHKIILAWILHECVEGYQNISIQDIAENYIEENIHTLDFIEGLSNEQEEVRYDIRFKAKDPNSLKLNDLIIDIEIQNDHYPGYQLSKRGIYYGCKLIAGQYGKEFKHSNYDAVKKVITIWFCMRPPKKQANSMIRYGLEAKVEGGEYQVDKEIYDLIGMIMVHVGRKIENKSIYQLLELLLVSDKSVEERKRILKEEYGIQMDEEMEREVDEMWGLAMEHFERGKNVGKTDGKIATTILCIKNAMLSLQVPIGKAMEILQIPKSEQPYYEEKIKESEE